MRLTKLGKVLIISLIIFAVVIAISILTFTTSKENKTEEIVDEYDVVLGDIQDDQVTHPVIAEEITPILDCWDEQRMINVQTCTKFILNCTGDMNSKENIINCEYENKTVTQRPKALMNKDGSLVYSACDIKPQQKQVNICKSTSKFNYTDRGATKEVDFTDFGCCKKTVYCQRFEGNCIVCVNPNDGDCDNYPRPGQTNIECGLTETGLQCYQKNSDPTYKEITSDFAVKNHLEAIK